MKLNRSLATIKKKKSGRDSQGHVSVRHQGGQHKRYLRLISDRRLHQGIKAKVVAIEYDPNRTARLALISYLNGAKAYILATSGLKVGDIITTGDLAPIKEGNRLCLKNIPVGIAINSIEFSPNSRIQLVRSAGSAAFIQSIDNNKVMVKLPSGEVRIFPGEAKATIGQVGNVDHSNLKWTKASDSRHRGIRPSVRGVAQNPHSHPHGGGEGRSSVGMNPKTPWGWPAQRKTRNPKKASNKLIISRKHK